MADWLRARRRLDRMGAMCLLVVMAPVFGIISLVAKRGHGSPVLLTVPRAGRGGHVFEMLKFRSMQTGSANHLAGGSPITGAADDRVTPTGAWLRRFHLDELPQLVNVIRGEMTLFGPRPEAVEFVDPSDVHWRAILSFPPGMAGPSQVLFGLWESQVLAVEGVNAYRTRVLPLKVIVDEAYVVGADFISDLSWLMLTALEWSGIMRVAVGERLLIVIDAVGESAELELCGALSELAIRPLGIFGGSRRFARTSRGSRDSVGTVDTGTSARRF
jgi:lipopolysaccharide/colanic/teichoic acid biosynthesis glycosyltransferase